MRKLESAKKAKYKIVQEPDDYYYLYRKTIFDWKYIALSSDKDYLIKMMNSKTEYYGE